MAKTINEEISKIESEIESRRQEIERLQARKAGLASGNRFVVAEYLHEKECHWNHTDGCGWYYGSWEPPLRSSRQQYLDRADKLLKLAKQHSLSLELMMEIRHV